MGQIAARFGSVGFSFLEQACDLGSAGPPWQARRSGRAGTIRQDLALGAHRKVYFGNAGAMPSLGLSSCRGRGLQIIEPNTTTLTPENLWLSLVRFLFGGVSFGLSARINP